MMDRTTNRREHEFGPLTRRELMVGGLALGGLALWPRASWSADTYALSPAVVAQLKKNSLVYISPLKSNGEESRCHGEVWYFVDGDAVVIGASSTGWKVKAVQSGLGEARLWVGDFGMGSSVGDKYKAGAHFRARVEAVKDDALFGRLLTAYGERYPGEWGKWKPRFEKGYADGTRVLLRYTPSGA